MRSNDKCAVF